MNDREQLLQWQIQGGAKAPLIFKPKKNWGGTAPPLCKGWMTSPPPSPYLKVWVRHCLGVNFREKTV